MKRVSPVMLFGLGEAGATSVKTISERLLLSTPELTPLVACVTLSNDGVLRDAKEETTIPLGGLKKELTPEVFSTNYAETLKQSDAISPWLAERFGRLLRQDARMALEDRGYNVDTTISLIFITE